MPLFLKKGVQPPRTLSVTVQRGINVVMKAAPSVSKSVARAKSLQINVSLRRNSMSYICLVTSTIHEEVYVYFHKFV